MPTAFEITPDDLPVALPYFSLSSVAIDNLMFNLDFNEIENAALSADDLDDQTTCAYNAIAELADAAIGVDVVVEALRHQLYARLTSNEFLTATRSCSSNLLDSLVNETIEEDQFLAFEINSGGFVSQCGHLVATIGYKALKPKLEKVMGLEILPLAIAA